MGYFIDVESCYEDIRAAETDEEQGRALMHHYMSGLDSGQEPEQVEPQRYEDVVVPQIEDALGVETPETEILEYDDGQQLMYDVTMEMSDAFGIFESVGKGAEQLLPENNGRIAQKMNEIALEANAAASTILYGNMGDGVAGIADPYGDHLEDGQVETETMAYSLPGIENMAESTGTSTEFMWDYVMTHEGIHTVQMAEYPELMQQRRDSIEDMKSLWEDPIKFSVDALDNVDPIELVRTLQNDRRAAATQVAEAYIEEFKECMSVPSMTLMEGHAEFNTDKAYDIDLRSQEEDDGSKDIVTKIIDETIMKPKKEQYEEGKEFFEVLHDAGGREYIHNAMKNPRVTSDHLDDPEALVQKLEDGTL